MELGLGLAALGRPAYLNVGHGADFAGQSDVASMRARTHALLDAAIAAGIRYVDAARSYGKAEEFLGAWPHLPRVTTGSKWGYRYVGDWRTDVAVHEVKDHSAAAFERQWAETRARLPGVALYQIHSATPEGGVLDDAPVLDRLRALRDTGVRVGVSVSGPRQAEVVRKAVGLKLFDSVQATWNLWERSCGDALAEARAAGLQVIVKEPLANGRLAAQDAVALAAALQSGWASIVLSGAVTVAQLHSNLRARTVSSAEVAQALADVKAVPPAEYWATRAKLPWT